MQIAILLFDRIAALDATGPFEVLSHIPGADIITVGEHTGPIRTADRQLGLLIDATLDDITHPDVIVIPGGPGIDAHLTDGPVHHWLHTADTTTTWTTSVCTGAFILATAGLLTGRRATTYWKRIDELAAHGATPVHERVVTDGKYITAAGVSAGIDMAITLAAHLTDDDIARNIQRDIEYDPQPPYAITTH